MACSHTAFPKQTMESASVSLQPGSISAGRLICAARKASSTSFRLQDATAFMYLLQVLSTNSIFEFVLPWISDGIPGRSLGKHEQHFECVCKKEACALQSAAVTYIHVFCFPHERRMCITR